MIHPALFLLVGYPGAGKTTTAQLLHEETGALHIWADRERKERFIAPTYSHAENLALYDILNELIDKLLTEGKSVIYDAGFNLRKDRDLLRRLAAHHGVRTYIIWVKTPLAIARERATAQAPHKQQTRVFGNMSAEHFDRIVSRLEPPTKDENPIIINGQKVTKESVHTILATME